jgi:hypothetical protein
VEEVETEMQEVLLLLQLDQVDQEVVSGGLPGAGGTGKYSTSKSTTRKSWRKFHLVVLMQEVEVVRRCRRRKWKWS